MPKIHQTDVSSPLKVPTFFGTVAPRLYRSGPFIDTDHFQFLKTLNLKTILFVGAGAPNSTLYLMAQQNDISLIHITGPSKDADPIGYDTQKAQFSYFSDIAKDTLEAVTREKYYPLLVMDDSGHMETGMVVGCLRRLQNWSISSILFEYESFSGSRTRLSIEEAIELFDIELVSLPPPNERAIWLDKFL